MHLLGVFIAGLVVSTVTTPAGVSGAVLLLPVQVSVLGVPSPAVTPTNLVFNLFATPSGVYRYWRLGRNPMESGLAKRLLIGTLPGVVLGAVVRVEWLSGQSAFYAAAGFVLVLLGATLLVRHPQAVSEPLALSVVPLIAFVVGIIGGVYGIGGGSFLAPILLIGGYSAYQVAPAALLSTFAASVVGVVSFVVLALTTKSGASIAPEWGIGISAGVGGVAGAYVGASIQHRIPDTRLRQLLGVVALAIACRYLYLGVVVA
jgi:uncharacterized membrane protein YfcA